MPIPGGGVQVSGNNAVATLGNPNIDPQKQFSYEIGYEAEFAEIAEALGLPLTIAPLLATVALSGVYGGYFGAAQGVILIALLGTFLPDDLQRLNGLKNVLAFVVNLVAALLFIVIARVITRGASERFVTSIWIVAKTSPVPGPGESSLGYQLRLNARSVRSIPWKLAVRPSTTTRERSGPVAELSQATPIPRRRAIAMVRCDIVDLPKENHRSSAEFNARRIRLLSVSIHMY